MRCVTKGTRATRFQAGRAWQTRGEREFEERDTDERMKGEVDVLAVLGATALVTGTGTLTDGTPLHYTAAVRGNAPIIGPNNFTISWITSTGSTFRTSGPLTDGYIVVHP